MKRWLLFIGLLPVVFAPQARGHVPESGSVSPLAFVTGERLVCTFDRTGTNVFQYYHPNHLTSTSIQTDQNGNRVQHYEYTAFGRTRYTLSTTAFLVSRRYTCQVLDEETGLYYYASRYYDPQLGRFIQPDDIISDLSNPQSYNRYSYVLNNPLRYTDPDGHGFVDNALDYAGGVVIGALRVLSPVPAQLQPEIPPSGTAERYGRQLGQNLAVSISIIEIIGGGTLAVCGGTVEVASIGAASPVAVPATGVGVAVAGHGTVGVNNWIYLTKKDAGASETPRLSGQNRPQNGTAQTKQSSKLEPDPRAQGAHTVFKRDPKTGKVTKYETYKPKFNPNDPNRWESEKRVDTQYAQPHTHFNKATQQPVPTPHVHEKTTPGGVRPAQPDELPK